VPVFFAVVFFAAAVLRAGFFFAVFFFATAIVHPSFGLAGYQFTLATPLVARHVSRFETRAVADEGKATGILHTLPFIALNVQLATRSVASSLESPANRPWSTPLTIRIRYCELFHNHFNHRLYGPVQ
jgi:hypothetical protein